MKSAKVTAEAPTTRECADLVRAAAAGDQASLDQLLRRAREVAGRFSYSVCGHSSDADDAVQVALISTYRNVGSIKDADAFRSWLYRTVRNACLVSRRKRAGEPPHMESLDESFAARRRNPEQLAEAADRRQDLRRALRALPGSYREVLFLREVEGLSTREVAAVTGISEDNVKTRLRRARARLQLTLSGNPPHPSAH
jgi:RNA polymerase sigma factor (sigma-70 family)